VSQFSTSFGAYRELKGILRKDIESSITKMRQFKMKKMHEEGYERLLETLSQKEKYITLKILATPHLQQ
jgi:hypothetical protein